MQNGGDLQPPFCFACVFGVVATLKKVEKFFKKGVAIISNTDIIKVSTKGKPKNKRGI